MYLYIPFIYIYIYFNDNMEIVLIEVEKVVFLWLVRRREVQNNIWIKILLHGIFFEIEIEQSPSST